MVLLIIMRTIDMKIVEFVRHDMEAGETTVYKIKLEVPFLKIAEKFLNGETAFVPVDVYKAKKHPKDIYNKKTGRITALNKEPKSELFKIVRLFKTSGVRVSLRLINGNDILDLSINLTTPDKVKVVSDKVIGWM